MEVELDPATYAPKMQPLPRAYLYDLPDDVRGGVFQCFYITDGGGNGQLELAIFWSKENAQFVQEAIPNCQHLSGKTKWAGARIKVEYSRSFTDAFHLISDGDCHEILYGDNDN